MKNMHEISGKTRTIPINTEMIQKNKLKQNENYKEIHDYL